MADEACADLAKALSENKILLSEMHRLGVQSPSHNSVRINLVLAMKTLLMGYEADVIKQGMPWNVQEFADAPHYLAPSERAYFKALAASWGAAIERQIADRPPNERAA
jgi:hypothetical protein